MSEYLTATQARQITTDSFADELVVVENLIRDRASSGNNHLECYISQANTRAIAKHLREQGFKVKMGNWWCRINQIKW